MFRIRMESLRAEHQRISNDDSLNNLRGAIDRIVKDAKQKHSIQDEGSLSYQLKKYDEFFSIYLLFSNDNITQALIRSRIENRKIKYPLKREWIRVFETFGFPINRKISIIKFTIFSINIYIKQNIKFIKFIFQKHKGLNFQKSAIIIGSKTENYLSGDLNNFGNWIYKNLPDGNYNKVYVECVSDNFKNLSNKFVYIDSFEAHIFPNSINKVIFLLTHSLSKIRLKHIYFKQPYLTFISLFVRDNNRDMPESVYVTASLPWIKSPIFHFMEFSGTKIIYINTSLAIDPQVHDKTNHVNWSEFSEWREIWCVSDLQVRHLDQLKLFNKPSFFNKGVPDWNDLFNYQLFDKSIARKGTIAIFDYEPNVNYFGYSSLNDLHLSYEETIFQFIQDIADIARKFNFNVFHKAKRDIGNRRSNNYQLFLNKLSAENNFFNSVDPNYSARRLINKTNATISIPFTSTSLIAKEEHKPCAFYDPNGRVNSNDRACSEIKVLLNIEELEHWFKNLN